MREINVQQIIDTVEKLCIDANNHLPSDVKCAIKNCRACEDGKIAQGVLDNIIENFEIASYTRRGAFLSDPFLRFAESGDCLIQKAQVEEEHSLGSFAFAYDPGLPSKCTALPSTPFVFDAMPESSRFFPYPEMSGVVKPPAATSLHSSIGQWPISFAVDTLSAPAEKSSHTCASSRATP